MVRDSLEMRAENYHNGLDVNKVVRRDLAKNSRGSILKRIMRISKMFSGHAGVDHRTPISTIDVFQTNLASRRPRKM